LSFSVNQYQFQPFSIPSTTWMLFRAVSNSLRIVFIPALTETRSDPEKLSRRTFPSVFCFTEKLNRLLSIASGESEARSDETIFFSAFNSISSVTRSTFDFNLFQNLLCYSEAVGGELNTVSLASDFEFASRARPYASTRSAKPGGTAGRTPPSSLQVAHDSAVTFPDGGAIFSSETFHAALFGRFRHRKQPSLSGPLFLLL